MALLCQKTGLQLSLTHPSLPLCPHGAAAFLVSSLLVVGTSAWHLVKGRRDELVKNRSRWVSGWCL